MPKMGQTETTAEELPEDDFDDLGFYALDDAEDYVNALYYGKEGTGKTTDAAAMANLPDARRVLIVNAEGGTKRGALAKRGIDTSKIVMWPRPGERVSFKGLEKLHARVLSDLNDDPKSWTGVIIDSLTEVTATLRENATTNRQAKLDRLGKTYDPDFVDISDYGQMTDQMRRLIRRFRDLPCHFVCTALEREDDNGMIGPAMTPSLATDVLGYVDFVLYTRATQGSAEIEDDAASEFRALTRPTAIHRAKDRFDVTPRVLADPSFDRLHLYTSGEITEDEDMRQQEYNERQSKRESEREEARAAQEAEREAKKAARKTRGTRRNTKAAPADESVTETQGEDDE